MKPTKRNQSRRTAWGSLLHIYRREVLVFTGFLTLLVAFVALLNDEYVCEPEAISGVVHQITMTKQAGYRTINMKKTAIVKLHDGGVMYIDNIHLNEGAIVSARRCKSKIFGLKQYR